MNEQKKRDLMLKFASENGLSWPDRATHIVTTGDEWNDSDLCKGAVEFYYEHGENKYENEARHVLDIKSWAIVCDREEFEGLTSSLNNCAPYGATHWHSGDSTYSKGYYQQGVINLFFWSDGQWKNTATKLQDLAGHVIPIHKPQENQDFQAKVGEKCLISNCGSDFEECTPKYISETYVIVERDYGEQHYHAKSVVFRALKTEAELDRELLIKSLYEIFAHGDTLHKSIESLVDAGWRPAKESDSH